jgi:catechol 2,3-dioxygenase-like lactoylglutathione lyase family enzyme
MPADFRSVGREPAIIRNDPVTRSTISVLACVLAGYAAMPQAQPGTTAAPAPKAAPRTGDAPMRLGNFSVSLAVKDLPASRAFYEKLGFHAVAGNGKTMLILQNDTCTIGLFQGMFDKNLLTFNPGWDRACATLPDFDDVRDIQRSLKKQGLTPAVAADESTTGPASLVVFDPDGNQIVIDQHVPAPKK